MANAKPLEQPFGYLSYGSGFTGSGHAGLETGPESSFRLKKGRHSRRAGQRLQLHIPLPCLPYRHIRPPMLQMRYFFGYYCFYATA